MWHHGWGWGWMMFGWAIGLAILVLLVWLVARAASTRDAPPPREESAEEILKQRYARGEIDEQQYQQMRDEMRKR